MPYTYTTLSAPYAAVWEAVDAWADLQESGVSVFQQRYRFDSATGEADMAVLREITPSESDLPALSIYPAVSRPDWYVNQMMNYEFTLDFALWTQDWGILEPMQLWEKITRACWKSAVDPDTVPRVKRITGHYPQAVGPIAFARAKIGKGQDGPMLTMTTWQLVLRVNFNPLA